jgi:hypothetical protein
MQMIGQDHHSVDGEGMRDFDPVDDVSKQLDIFRQKRVPLAFGAVDREKVGTAGNFGSSVVGHGVVWAVRILVCRAMRFAALTGILRYWMARLCRIDDTTIFVGCGERM